MVKVGDDRSAPLSRACPRGQFEAWWPESLSPQIETKLVSAQKVYAGRLNNIFLAAKQLDLYARLRRYRHVRGLHAFPMAL